MVSQERWQREQAGGGRPGTEPEKPGSLDTFHGVQGAPAWEAVWAGAAIPPLAKEELGVPLGDAAFPPGGRRAPAGTGWPQSGVRSQPPNSPAFAFLPQTDSHRIRGRFP